MKVLLPSQKREIEVKKIKTVRQLLAHFSFNEEEVLVMNKKTSELLTHDERLREDMNVGIIRVLSGG